jgi:hypothetical protein
MLPEQGHHNRPQRTQIHGAFEDAMAEVQRLDGEREWTGTTG